MVMEFVNLGMCIAGSFVLYYFAWIKRKFKYTHGVVVVDLCEMIGEIRGKLWKRKGQQVAHTTYTSEIRQLIGALCLYKIS